MLLEAATGDGRIYTWRRGTGASGYGVRAGKRKFASRSMEHDAGVIAEVERLHKEGLIREILVRADGTSNYELTADGFAEVERLRSSMGDLSSR